MKDLTVLKAGASSLPGLGRGTPDKGKRKKTYRV
jgi:hypothetical protein